MLINLKKVDAFQIMYNMIKGKKYFNFPTFSQAYVPKKWQKEPNIVPSSFFQKDK